MILPGQGGASDWNVRLSHSVRGTDLFRPELDEPAVTFVGGHLASAATACRSVHYRLGASLGVVDLLGPRYPHHQTRSCQGEG